jgi:hypothetical protein
MQTTVNFQNTADKLAYHMINQISNDALQNEIKQHCKHDIHFTANFALACAKNAVTSIMLHSDPVAQLSSASKNLSKTITHLNDEDFTTCLNHYKAALSCLIPFMASEDLIINNITVATAQAVCDQFITRKNKVVEIFFSQFPEQYVKPFCKKGDYTIKHLS